MSAVHTSHPKPTDEVQTNAVSVTPVGGLELKEMAADGKTNLLLETWTSSATLKTPDATKLSWNSGPSAETQQGE